MHAHVLAGHGYSLARGGHLWRGWHLIGVLSSQRWCLLRLLRLLLLLVLRLLMQLLLLQCLIELQLQCCCLSLLGGQLLGMLLISCC